MTRSAGTPDARPRSSPPMEIDITVPSVARVHDYLLGGKEHFESDRAAARGLFRALPEAAMAPRENRAFVRRAVRHLVAEAGVRQILDIGSGLPGEGAVHEVAQAIDPSVRVAYADIDPVVVAHGRALLSGIPHITLVGADVRDPDTVFGNPYVGQLVDFAQPFAILLTGVLHHLPDADDPVGIVDDLVARLPAGGHLVLSNLLGGDHPSSGDLEHEFRRQRISPARFRTWAEQQRFFAGVDLVEPGLVYLDDWRPDAATPTDSPVHTLQVAGVGRKPG